MSNPDIDLDVALDRPASAPALGSERDPFARTLRTAGALLLATSASAFMFQHWSERDDVGRYFMLLGHTAVVAISAVLCGAGLRAARSARTLFGLVLASLPVHFAVLGALLYSSVGAASAGMPSAAIWHAPSLGVALLTALGATVVLVPSGYLALRALARAHAGRLAAVIGCANALLLIPVREPSIVSCLLLAGTALLLVVDGGLARAPELRTFEGRACRFLYFVPLLVIAVRTLAFHDVSAPFVASVLLAAGWAWSALCGRRGAGSGAVTAQRFAVLPVGLAAWVLAGELASPAGVCACFVVLCALLFAALARGALGGAGFYYTAAGYVACAVLLLDAWHRPTPAAALVALLGGAVVMALAAGLQRLALLAVASVTTLVALILELQRVIDISALRHWGALAGAGILLILGAAVLERHGRALARRANELRSGIAAWEW